MKKRFLRLKKVIIILTILGIGTILLLNNYVNSFEGKFKDFEVSDSDKIEGVTDKVESIGGTVISVIRIVSVTIAIVMLLVIAMRYMIAAPGERADLKKHAVAYIVGAFILFGVTGILTILVEFSKEISA